MLLTPRLLSLVFAIVFVFARPYVVGAQSKSPQASAPKAATTPAPQASAPKAATAPAPAPVPAPVPARAPAPVPAPVAAPVPAPAPAAAPPTPAATAGSTTLLEPQGYTYDPAGRRDPFVSLVRRGSDTLKSGNGGRGAGLAGLETSEVTLKGTIASEGGFVGIVQGVDNKTYIVRPGDKLLDGTIRAITQDAMVITQQVTDPLSLEKQREVRKVLRQTEEAK